MNSERCTAVYRSRAQRALWNNSPLAYCPKHVDAASVSWAIPTAWICIGASLVFGLGVMMSNSTYIERPILVGSLTLLGSLLAAFWLNWTLAHGGFSSWFQVVSICILGTIFFALGWMLDYLSGPPPLNREADEETLGAHVSD